MIAVKINLISGPFIDFFAQTTQKALELMLILKKVAKKAVESYNGRAPTKTDIFTEGNEGSVIKLIVG